MSYNSAISIHALREEGDLKGHAVGAVRRTFLSTPSARRATHGSAELKPGMDISIHALREEGDRMELEAYGHDKISIHALREEGDTSTDEQAFGYQISIHALREEGDRLRVLAFGSLRNFYPRPPRGGRRLNFC